MRHLCFISLAYVLVALLLAWPCVAAAAAAAHYQQVLVTHLPGRSAEKFALFSGLANHCCQFHTDSFVFISTTLKSLVTKKDRSDDIDMQVAVRQPAPT